MLAHVSFIFDPVGLIETIMFIYPSFLAVKFGGPACSWFLVIDKKLFSNWGSYELDLWPFGPKNKKVHLFIMSNQPVSLKFLAAVVLELFIGNHFQNAGPCEFDLWPCGLKNIRNHLFIMSNLPTKSRVHVPICSQVTDQKWNGLQTDRPNLQNNISPLFWRGHNYMWINHSPQVTLLCSLLTILITHLMIKMF